MKSHALKKIMFLVGIVVFLGISSCQSGNTHKKLKPGKPIPCPQKDC
jgi:hypothetical protein